MCQIATTTRAGQLKSERTPPDPHTMTTDAKETTRQIYDIADPALAAHFVDQLTADLSDISMPPEVRSLGRTISRGGIRSWRGIGLGCRTARPRRSTISSNV